jgi:hypothetical protein
VKIKTIAAGYERKFNLGDYNSLNLEVTCWADLEDGDDPEASIQAIQDKCRNAVRAEYGRYLQSASRVGHGQAVTAKQQASEPAKGDSTDAVH